MYPIHKNPILAERIIRESCVVELNPAFIKISTRKSSLLIGHWPNVQVRIKRKCRNLGNAIDIPLSEATAQWEWGGMPVRGDQRQTYFDLLGMNPMSPSAPTLIEREILSTIPLRIRKLINLPMGGELHLLVIFAKAPAAVELCENNPSLFHLLRQKILRRMPPNAWNQTCQLPQRKLHELLGFPSSASFVKILRKTRIDYISPDDANELIEYFKSGGVLVKYLHHLPVINELHYVVMSDPVLTAQVNYNFMLDACKITRRKCMAMKEYDPMYWKEIPGEKEPHFTSFKEIHQWVEKQSTREMKLLSSHEGDFPPPPFPGTPNIQPITNPDELEREGEVQHNCAISYMLAIIMRFSYMYRVLNPRATLLVTRKPAQSEWEISDIRLACNEPLPQAIEEELSRELIGAESAMSHENN